MKKGLQPTHMERLDPRIRRIWGDLGRIGPRYTLIGGTAIALYCNHRLSVDVDISCRGAAEHPRTIRKNIGAEIGKHKVLQRRNGIVIKFFATETSPKIEVHGTDPWKIAAPPVRADNGLLVAAPSDLAARKLVAMIERDSPRDGEDLQALQRTGADIGAAARHLVAHLDRQSLERLGERLQQNPQERWPGLVAHKRVLASLQMAATGIIEPPPSLITFEEKDPRRFDLIEEQLETGSRAVLIQVRSVREGLEWLARNGRIPTSEIPTFERELELRLQRDRDRGMTR
ncbi:MAG: nucleotidyl transferase AbiEii/AbiGii toxin family protein [Acidobacteria bacterium]|nr:nucleotidyl transferase AbiEii/AbiGii toxin family protein [Acidobacteriota bacterium]MYH48694.1 nucleotidyl transferase AbiEii/AbiGii toxin family protein [Gammaproteobacteria bacterium]MYK80104.1 nucleotidyl transferase AbiEii/AbiGii toxin family protein [Acidobacteriota bacterium]